MLKIKNFLKHIFPTVNNDAFSGTFETLYEARLSHDEIRRARMKESSDERSTTTNCQVSCSPLTVQGGGARAGGGTYIDAGRGGVELVLGQGRGGGRGQPRRGTLVQEDAAIGQAVLPQVPGGPMKTKEGLEATPTPRSG